MGITKMKFLINKNRKVNGEPMKIRNHKDGSFYPANQVFDLGKMDIEEKTRFIRMFKVGDLIEAPVKQKKEKNGE